MFQLDLLTPEGRRPCRWDFPTANVTWCIRQMLLEYWAKPGKHLNDRTGLSLEMDPDTYSRIKEGTRGLKVEIIYDLSTPAALQRPRGFYWVRPPSGWEIMLWNRTQWRSYRGDFMDKDMLEILESRLEQP